MPVKFACWLFLLPLACFLLPIYLSDWYKYSKPKSRILAAEVMLLLIASSCAADFFMYLHNCPDTI